MDYSSIPQDIINYYKMIYFTYGIQFPLYGNLPDNIYAKVVLLKIGADYQEKANIAKLKCYTEDCPYIFTDEFINFLENL